MKSLFKNSKLVVVTWCSGCARSYWFMSSCELRNWRINLPFCLQNHPLFVYSRWWRKGTKFLKYILKVWICAIYKLTLLSYLFLDDEIPVIKKLELVKEMDEEFGKKRKVIVNGLPVDFTEKVMNFIMYTCTCTYVNVFWKECCCQMHNVFEFF